MVSRISLVLNTVLCVLLILVALFALVSERDFSSLSLSIISVIFLMTGIFLSLNFICYRLYKINKEQVIISKRIKRLSKIVIILSVLNTVALLFFMVSAMIEFDTNWQSSPDKKLWPLIFTLVLFFVLMLTAILNLFTYKKALQKNKLLIAEVINEIGS